MTTEATADQQPSQPVAVLSSEGLGPLAAAVRDVMAHQWSNNREAMDALTRLIDAANDAQSVLCMVADTSHSVA